MRRGPLIVSVAIFGLIACYPVAYALDTTPDRVIGAAIGGGIFVTGCLVTVAQVARR